MLARRGNVPSSAKRLRQRDRTTLRLRGKRHKECRELNKKKMKWECILGAGREKLAV